MDNRDDRRALLNKLNTPVQTSGLVPSPSGGFHKVWFILPAMALLVFAGYYFFPKEDQQVAEIEPARQGKAEPEEAISRNQVATPDSLMASGYIIARREATIAAEITGRITQILVEEGMQVEQGQIIAKLDD